MVQIWTMKQEQVQAVAKKLLQADRVIHEQQLGWQWHVKDEEAMFAGPHDKPEVAPAGRAAGAAQKQPGKGEEEEGGHCRSCCSVGMSLARASPHGLSAVPCMHHPDSLPTLCRHGGGQHSTAPAAGACGASPEPQASWRQLSTHMTPAFHGCTAASQRACPPQILWSAQHVV